MSKLVASCEIEMVPGTQISARRLPWQRNDFAGHVPAVYFLVRDGRVTYIGESRNLVQRIRQQQNCGRQFDEVYFVPCCHAQLKFLEATLIVRLRPAENVKVIDPAGIKLHSGYRPPMIPIRQWLRIYFPKMGARWCARRVGLTTCRVHQLVIQSEIKSCEGVARRG